MSPIPQGGYQNPSPEAQQALEDFDQRFSRVINSLQSAWTNGSQSDLGGAVRSMLTLQGLANALFQIPLPDGSGVYGPDFKYLA